MNSVTMLHRIDNSGIFVWTFLGLCGLIVVMQVVPAVMLFWEMIKAPFKVEVPD